MSDIERSVYERLPTWAARPGQTPEQILATQRQLEEITSKFSMSNAIKIRYVQLRGYIEGNSDTIAQYFDLDKGRLQSTAFWLNLPWEKARSLRILNSRTRGMLALLASVDREAATDSRLWHHDVIGLFRPKYRTWIIENFYPLDNLVPQPT